MKETTLTKNQRLHMINSFIEVAEGEDIADFFTPKQLKAMSDEELLNEFIDQFGL